MNKFKKSFLEVSNWFSVTRSNMNAQMDENETLLSPITCISWSDTQCTVIDEDERKKSFNVS